MTMGDQEDVDATMEDDYDEEADGDFDAGNVSDQINSSSSEEDDDQIPSTKQGRPKSRFRAKDKGKSQPEPLELDSGDEATIQERKRAKRKQQQKGQDEPGDNSDIEEQGWRARTRAMREKDQVEKKKSRLASVKGSTVDVDQMWEAMNRPGGLDDLLKPTTASATGHAVSPPENQKENIGPSHILSGGARGGEADDSRDSHEGVNDMITIDETYEFAGEVHHRKKSVPKSSAEAKLWLSQRSYQNTDPRFQGDEPIRRPLRRISRFDPNVNNLDSFRKNWEKTAADGKGSKVHKVNTVEKSKMDWAAHVDQEGLQDELSEHAKAKAGYLGRMDFLGQVEQRKEEEARRARLHG
jgi:Bucentaur or craniofacial development